MPIIMAARCLGKAGRFSREKVVRRLLAHRDRFILPSMISLNVRFGVSKSNFFIRHRELCAEYGAMRRAQAKTRSSLRFVTGLTAARQVVDLAIRSGQALRRIDTISWLRKSLMLSKGVARSALRTALLEAYYLTKRKKLNQGVDD